jgi:hypothetical protein
MHETKLYVFHQDFSLKPGERITACAPLHTSASDRILHELGNCHHCLCATHRVIVVTAESGLERRAALCVNHFVEAVRSFPELQQQQSA